MTTRPSILPLALEGLSFVAGGQTLINDISCVLEAGPRTLVLGPNGAGKSLLLRLCHGLLAPSRGRVVWRGKAGRTNGRTLAHAQAMVFQRPVMLRRSVAANIRFALAVQGIPRAERAAIVDDMLARTGLDRFARQQARLLSVGEQQRLALARAWALRPEVLFLDEPTASLDPAATHAIEKLIAAIHQAGTKIVMTTHDLGQAHRLADEVLFLHQGCLLERSDAAAFFTGPRNDLASAFLRGELLWRSADESVAPQPSTET